MSKDLKALKTNYNALLKRIDKALEYFDNKEVIDKLTDEKISELISKFTELDEFRVKNLKEIEKEMFVTTEQIIKGFKIC